MGSTTAAPRRSPRAPWLATALARRQRRFGGGIDNSGSLTISGTTVSSNRGGAGADRGGNSYGAGGDGGGIANTPPSGTLSLDTSTVSTTPRARLGLTATSTAAAAAGSLSKPARRHLPTRRSRATTPVRARAGAVVPGATQRRRRSVHPCGFWRRCVLLRGGAAPTATNVTIADRRWPRRRLEWQSLPGLRRRGRRIYTGNGDLALANSIVASSTVGLNCDGNFSVLQDDGHNLGFGDSSCLAVSRLATRGSVRFRTTAVRPRRWRSGWAARHSIRCPLPVPTAPLLISAASCAQRDPHAISARSSSPTTH